MFSVLDVGFLFFFFNDTATTEIYTLSLHDALPILDLEMLAAIAGQSPAENQEDSRRMRSEEHTSELQSQSNLVCRLLLEKKKNKTQNQPSLLPKKYIVTLERT